MATEEFWKGSVVGRHGIKSVQVVIILTALGGAVLGFIGFYSSLASADFSSRLLLSAVGTAQLFILGVEVPELVNLPLQVAALIAPSATATVLWAVFASTVAGWWFRFRNQRCPPYAVVLGGGHLANIIVNHYKSCGRIIILDTRDNPELHGRAGLPAGVVHRVGDALDPAELLAVNACRAQRVWIVTGDDRRNLDILQLLHQQLKAETFVVADRQWFVDLYKRELLRHASNLEDEWRAQNPLIGVDTIQFNLERMIAREVLKFCLCHPQGPADQIWRSRRPQSGFHVAIVGNGDLAEELALHAIQYLVVDERPSCAPWITWFGSGVRDRRAKLLGSFPVLDSSSASLPHFEAILPLTQLQAIDVDELRLSIESWAQAQRERPFDVIIIAVADDETQDLVLRQVIAQQVCTGIWPGASATPIVVVSTPSAPVGFADSLIKKSDIHPEIRSCLYGFDSAQIWRSGESYPGAECDQTAKQLHAHFNANRVQAGETAEAIWKSAKEFERWSSRYAADHIDTHRRLASLVPSTTDTVEAIARVEHRRFVVERLMDGWLPPPKDRHVTGALAGKALKRLRVHPDLVPWDDIGLDSSSRKSTLDLVKKFLERAI